MKLKASKNYLVKIEYYQYCDTHTHSRVKTCEHSWINMFEVYSYVMSTRVCRNLSCKREPQDH